MSHYVARWKRTDVSALVAWLTMKTEVVHYSETSVPVYRRSIPDDRFRHIRYCEGLKPGTFNNAFTYSRVLLRVKYQFPICEHYFTRYQFYMKYFSSYALC
jgi:hypothetical protein